VCEWACGFLQPHPISQDNHYLPINTRFFYQSKPLRNSLPHLTGHPLPTSQYSLFLSIQTAAQFSTFRPSSIQFLFFVFVGFSLFAPSQEAPEDSLGLSPHLAASGEKSVNDQNAYIGALLWRVSFTLVRPVYWIHRRLSRFRMEKSRFLTVLCVSFRRRLTTAVAWCC